MTSASLTADMLATGSDASIVVETIDSVRLLIFNRKQARNALSRAMRREFSVLLQEAGADGAIGCVIVTGAGGTFTAGSDIKESRADPGHPIIRPHPGEAIRALTKPVIAAIDGPCMTGGLEIALSASFAIASDRSSFADTHAKVGLFPAWGLSALLPRAIGAARARQMSLSGVTIDARTACDWGLVNEVVEPAALLPRCLAIAAQIGAADARSVRWQLAHLRATDGKPITDALAAEEAAVERWRAGEADPL